MNFPNSPADGEYLYDSVSGNRYQFQSGRGWVFAGNTASLLTIFYSRTGDYALANTDAENMLEVNVSDDPATRSMVNIYIPNDGQIFFNTGVGFNLVQKGNAKIRIVPNTDVVLYSTGANSSSQNAVVTLLKQSTNTWYAFGGLTA